MHRIASSLAASLRTASNIAVAVAALGLAAMTAIIGWQIFGRYVLNDTPIWSERLSILLMNWYILLAAAAGVRENFHIGLVLFRDRARGRLRLAIEVLVNASVAAFGVAMMIYGTELAQRTVTHTIPTLGLSNAWSYAPFPIAGLLITLFSLERIAAAIAADPRETAAGLPGSEA